MDYLPIAPPASTCPERGLLDLTVLGRGLILALRLRWRWRDLDKEFIGNLGKSVGAALNPSLVALLG